MPMSEDHRPLLSSTSGKLRYRKRPPVFTGLASLSRSQSRSYSPSHQSSLSVSCMSASVAGSLGHGMYKRTMS